MIVFRWILLNSAGFQFVITSYNHYKTVKTVPFLSQFLYRVCNAQTRFNRAYFWSIIWFRYWCLKHTQPLGFFCSVKKMFYEFFGRLQLRWSCRRTRDMSDISFINPQRPTAARAGANPIKLISSYKDRKKSRTSIYAYVL